MREIEFRIRGIDKTWYYGVPLSKIKNDTVAFQSFDGKYYDLFADATTLGQYTGKVDINGNKLFEGDIVFYTEFKKEGFLYVLYENFEYFLTDGESLISLYDAESFELLLEGNIYDNPELLKGGAK